MGYEEYLDSVKRMIDDLKAMTADLGLANTGDEYKIISELFTYKFLNDKLLYEFEQREDKSESFEDFVDYADSGIARIKKEHLLTNLFQKQNDPKFHKMFDSAMKEISEMNQDVFSIETSTGMKKPLLEALSVYLRDPDKENELARRAINILCKYKFTDIYSKGWDYFSSVFEYLIKDFNKDSGKYAEYYTPAFAGAIMADILYNDTLVEKVSLYDPAAGSGTLLLSMADKIGTKNCTLFSQDRSQKSTQFLRINLILNNLAHSLSNVIEGNTMLNPAHLDGDKLKQFDFIVSNPPFNVDFSADVDAMNADIYGRFFAGIPNIPKKDLKSMAIYLPFLQHIMASLSPNGKAAIVVPTGFLTAKKGIAFKIREEIINNNWLTGAISMPSNIFANTTTSVSIIFIDKGKTSDTVFLMEANKLGTKIKVDDLQRTVLSEDDEEKIVSYFKNKIEEAGFSINVTKDKIKKKNYSFSAGQYFEVQIEYEDLSYEEYTESLCIYKEEIKKLFEKGHLLEKQILRKMEDLYLDE